MHATAHDRALELAAHSSDRLQAKSSEGTSPPLLTKRRVSTVTWQSQTGAALLSIALAKLFGHTWPWRESYHRISKHHGKAAALVKETRDSRWRTLWHCTTTTTQTWGWARKRQGAPPTPLCTEQARRAILRAHGGRRERLFSVAKETRRCLQSVHSPQHVPSNVIVG